MSSRLKPSATRLSALAVGTSLAAAGFGAGGTAVAYAAVATTAAVPTLTEPSRMTVHADLTGSFADTDIDAAKSVVQWGDGTTSSLTIDPVTRALSVGDHTYTTTAARGYTVVLYLVEQGASTSIVNEADIVVGDFAYMWVPQNAHYGSTVTALPDAFADKFDTNVTYSIDWGDGHTDTTKPGEPFSALTGTHVYATPRMTPYTVVLTVFDNGVAAATSSQPITINPSAVQAELQSRGGRPFTVYAYLDGSSVDSLATPATYTIDWGDGTPQAPDIQTLHATGAALPADPSHKYAAAGTYTITLTIHDAFGSTGTASTTQVVDAPWNPAPITQYAGADRYRTSLLASQARWADHGVTGGPAGRVEANAVVLATGTAFPDALSGVPLAKAKNGPLLLTDGKQSSVDPAVLAEIQRILPEGGAIYILGQTGAVSQGIQKELSGLGYQITRYGGADRYATSLEIAQLGMNNPSHVVVARGDQGADNNGFADALSSGPFAADVFGGGGAAVVLSDDKTLTPAVATYVKSKFSTTAVDVAAVGGAAVSAVGTLPGAGKAATDIAGADRYDTAWLVAQRFALNAPIGIATGLQFPDAMTGGAYLASVGGPLILTDPASETVGDGGTAQAVFRFRYTRSAVSVFGGDAAVSPAVVKLIMAQLGQSNLDRIS